MHVSKAAPAGKILAWPYEYDRGSDRHACAARAILFHHLQWFYVLHCRVNQSRIPLKRGRGRDSDAPRNVSVRSWRRLKIQMRTFSVDS